MEKLLSIHQRMTNNLDGIGCPAKAKDTCQATNIFSEVLNLGIFPKRCNPTKGRNLLGACLARNNYEQSRCWQELGNELAQIDSSHELDD